MTRYPAPHPLASALMAVSAATIRREYDDRDEEGQRRFERAAEACFRLRDLADAVSRIEERGTPCWQEPRQAASRKMARLLAPRA